MTVSISSHHARAVAWSIASRLVSDENSVAEPFKALSRPSKPFSSTFVSPLMTVAVNFRTMAFLDSSRLSAYRSGAASFATRSMSQASDRMATWVFTRSTSTLLLAGSVFRARKAAVLGVFRRL